MDNKNVLTIPLWLLFNIKSIDEIKLDEVLAKNLKSYEIDTRKYLYEVIKKIEKGYNFDEIISNIPNNNQIKFTDNEIYEYLIKFKQFMENENFEILK